MSDSLFLPEFLEANNDEELKKIQRKYGSFDPYYVTTGCINERKNKIDTLWNKFQHYCDKNFPIEIRTQFHQRSWEMYIGNILLEKNCQINRKTVQEGPDFLLDSMYIECIACTKGDPNKPNSVPELELDGNVQDIPTDKMLLRITSAINEKIKQYQNWKTKNWYKGDFSFIIAINTGDLQHMQNLDIPIIIKAVFGLQYMQIDKNNTVSHKFRDQVMKNGNVHVPVHYFTNSEYNFISGILFSDNFVISHPGNVGDDCILINNPFAKNPLKSDFIDKFRNRHWELKDREITGKKNY